MKLKLNEQDLKGEFIDIKDCPIARALKRNGFKEIYVGGASALIDGVDYFFDSGESRKVQEAKIAGTKSITVEIEGLKLPEVSFIQRVKNFFR